MKANKYMATLVASLAVVSTASAAPPAAVRVFDEVSIPLADRLAGWQTFTAANPATTATEVKPGFSASATLGAAPSGVGYGNAENVYGGSNWSAPSGGFNGSASITTAPSSFSLKNLGQNEVQIGWLFFDVQRQAGEGSPDYAGPTPPNPVPPVGAMKISYAGPDGSGVLLPSVTGFSTTNDYTDFNYDLTSFGFILGLNEEITFTFERISGASPWLDNVGLAYGTSVIPEPGSMLALGCFLGSGLLIRRNRRSVA